MSFSVCVNFDIWNFAKSVQAFSFSLKSPTSKCFCENNYNFACTANFCKLPRAFALFLHTFSRNILRKQVFSEKMYQISCHWIFHKTVPLFHVMSTSLVFVINIRKSQHLEVFVIFSEAIFAKMPSRNFRDNHNCGIVTRKDDNLHRLYSIHGWNGWYD
jgi:hypothetical protein